MNPGCVFQSTWAHSEHLYTECGSQVSLGRWKVAGVGVLRGQRQSPHPQLFVRCRILNAALWAGFSNRNEGGSAVKNPLLQETGKLWQHLSKIGNFLPVLKHTVKSCHRHAWGAGVRGAVRQREQWEELAGREQVS